MPYLNLSLSFFSNLQRLMISSPTAAHESILTAIIWQLSSVLATIPLPKGILTYQTHGNRHIQGQTICGIPDLTIMMVTEGSLEDRPIWLMESAFSQSNADVMEKLHAYIEDHPDLLVVGKVLLKQNGKYSSPGANSSLATSLRSSELLSRRKWRGSLGVDEFAHVDIDRHIWFSLSSVEIHLWICQASGLDIDCKDGNGYAFGVHWLFCGNI